MRLLLDTHVLLWALQAPERLGDRTRSALEDVENEVLFSPVSIWEIAFKTTLGRDDFAFDPEIIIREALEIGFVEAPVRARAAMLVASLPLHHRDPFDRLLIAQAIHAPARFLTADRFLAVYSDLVTLF